MKKFISTVIAVAVPVLFIAVPMRGEETSIATSLSSAEDSLRKSGVEAERAQVEAQKLQQDAGRQYRQARELTDRVRVQIAQAESGYQSVGGGGAGGGGSVDMSPPPSGTSQFSERLATVIQRPGNSGGPGRTLVIRSGDGEPGTQAALEEDMAVMAHIFDKAIAEKIGPGNRERTAMGINVYFGPNADSIRNLYLDGYGALFTLRVNFPLLAPPKVSEVPKEKPATTSEWEEAKREVYSRDEGRTIPSRTMRLPGPFEAGEEYSEQKVAQLKDALLESLKSAANIRNLKSDDSITVCVFGGPGMASGFYRASSGGRGAPQRPPANPPAPGAQVPPTVDPTTGLPVPSTEPFPVGATSRVAGWPARGSILTIRVKKSDVDAFAKGKLDLDQFRKKASMTIYPGGGDGGFTVQRWEY
jgi:hypothetical protein